jgi:hypothetical protein
MGYPLKRTVAAALGLRHTFVSFDLPQLFAVRGNFHLTLPKAAEALE